MSEMQVRSWPGLVFSLTVFASAGLVQEIVIRVRPDLKPTVPGVARGRFVGNRIVGWASLVALFIVVPLWLVRR
jgi:hypothetical protein